MKVITLKQPWATLVAESLKNMNLEVGSIVIEENC